MKAPAMLICLAAAATAACQTPPQSASPQDRFLARLGSLCGKAYAGRIVTTDAADRAMVEQPLVMHVASCTASEIRIPFHVGDDRSRTWIVSRTETGLRLKHDHRHSDGSSDALTMYGGDTVRQGSSTRQAFPADDSSITMFRAQDRAVSVSNVWAIEVDDRRFAYELRRPPGPDVRRFRVEFDLTRPVPPPPLPWGWGTPG